LDKRVTIEFMGTVGVIASLIFVGLQVQQGAIATRSATVLQLKDSWVQLNLAGATSPDLVKAFETVQKEGWGADSLADSMVGSFYRALIHNWSNAYYQYENGTLEESQWAPHLREMKVNASNQLLLKFWSEWSYIYDDHFQELMNDLISDAD
jgi:hypothetical protein